MVETVVVVPEKYKDWTLEELDAFPREGQLPPRLVELQKDRLRQEEILRFQQLQSEVYVLRR
ncbi:hypothetical protein A2160_05695 [Candidatus Beckwithbacteria bacterium RBG_13_42_9]|uniref:Uncharacterized protein n=1 Tax=Candidatus Beckwithbacteria bacterium RBG_13_42_9 TaxID=1797457 RepID=A0A1F5E6A9_9BACT|nr:MAG: hypothetical protein A2160_05695 [Candidatus Beckwithbacteria bacterium RBG_13_42_9]